MHSLRTRITFLTVWLIVIAVTVVTLVSVLFIRNNERHESEQLLLLLCESGERNLDYYFNSVQKSVEKISSFAETDLDGLEAGQLSRHIKRVEKYFGEMASKTNGVLTYYYRIDPEISETVKGFWYTDLDGEGFVEHEVTDITLYDTQDTSKLVWFTVPKHTGESIWLPPYITDNLAVRVISYNVPIYWKSRFVGVAGIEIDYSTMAEQIDSIRLFHNGYAFLSDEKGNLFFHPRIDVTMLNDVTMPQPPEGMDTGSTFFRYTYEGVEKQAAWLPLCNGMRLNISVPISETEGDWQSLVHRILIASLIVLLTLSFFTLSYTRHITRPLEELTRAAEQADQGNYDFSLKYKGNDEVGRLTSTFQRMADNMKNHINDLNNRVYIDALTSVKNKGAFTAAMEKLEEEASKNRETTVFAVGMFDCNDLKIINDQYGHDRGDIYLKTACRLICRIFHHSPVFRIGGDEFAVILRKEEYLNRAELLHQFEESRKEICASASDKWEEVHIAVGITEYDPRNDHSVFDTVRRADKIMYTNKREQKEKEKA